MPARPARRAARRAAGAGAVRELAAELGRARQRAGLSGRALAALAGIPVSTLSAAEHGRDIGLSRLIRLAATLTDFDAAAVVGRRDAPRPAAAAEWRFLADAHGFTAERVTIDVQVHPNLCYELGITVSGVRTTRGSLGDGARRTAILGAILAGSPGVVEQLTPAAGVTPGGSCEVEDGDVLHVFDLPRQIDRHGLRYRRLDRRPPIPPEQDALGLTQHGRPFSRGATYWLDYCARELVFRLHAHPELAPLTLSVWAWPPSLGVDPVEPINRWPDLYPGLPGQLCAAPEAELRIEHPAPVTCYGLSWDESGQAPGGAASAQLVARPTRSRSFSRSLGQARRAAGLSRRGLARKLAVSPATVVELEQGREPRLSTTAGVLEALPGLSPWAFLPCRPKRQRVDARQLWNTQRAFFGFESAREIREISVSASGDAEMRAQTVGLSWNNLSRHHLRIRLGTKPDAQYADKDLCSVEFDAGQEGLEARIRRLMGLQAHELSLESGAASPRISFTRLVQLPGMFALSIERSLRERMSLAECWRAGRSVGDGRTLLAESTLIEPWFPTRRLVLRVQLPPDYVADEPIAKVIPLSVYAVEDLEDLRPRVHASGFRFTVGRGGRLLTLEVVRPLVGLRYLISWLMAGAREKLAEQVFAELRRRG